MRFFTEDAGGARHEILVTELSGHQLRQAAAIADTVAGMIPHEGVDYGLKVPGDNAPFDLEAYTDKGRAWCGYVAEMSQDVSRIDNVYSHIGSLIPEDGADYDPCIIFKTASGTLSYAIRPITAKGRFWMKYVTAILRKAKKGQENEKIVS